MENLFSTDNPSSDLRQIEAEQDESCPVCGSHLGCQCELDMEDEAADRKAAELEEGEKLLEELGYI